MSLRTENFYYQAKNNTTGLTDVTANIWRNGASVATAVALTEQSSSLAPGVYVLALTAAMLTGYGGAGQYEVVINSASKSAEAIASRYISVANTDDLDAHLTTQDTTLSAIKSDVEDSTNGLAAIKTAINAIATQVSSIQNNTSFEAYIPSGGFVVPQSGSQVYRIPINIQNEHGSIADADSNSITVTLANVSGTDRGSLMTGYSAGSAPAVRDAAGKYHIDVTLTPSTALEELLFNFAYTISAAPYSKQRGVTILNNVQADGFALQSTLLSVQTTAGDTNTKITDVQTKVNDATIGLAALQALSSGIQGTGFVGSTDALHPLATFIYANLYSGGKAV